jgi:benzodiazapine receptor
MENVVPKRTGHMVALIGWFALCFAVAGISGAFSARAMPTWYASLIWRSPASRARSRALMLFCVQLALNLAWSAIFFVGHWVGAAMAEIVLLWLAILMTMLAFFVVRRDAAWLMIPYLAWVFFAGVLNWAIWRLN